MHNFELNILNSILEKIMKIWYFENTHRDESNDILYDIIYLCILVEKYRSKLQIFNWVIYCGTEGVNN